MNDKATLLFVDDEERILRSLKIMFRSEYNVLTSTTGQEALEIVRRNNVHVVVSDQRMPAMLGVDLLREIKTISPSTMRILLTGYADKEAVIDSINEGEIFRYINKPWNADEIRATLSKAAAIAMNYDDAVLEAATVGRAEVMVLDEDPKVADYIGEILNKEIAGGYGMVWADSLESAVKLVSRGTVAVAVAELHLAGEDISAFVKILKHHAPQIVTIVTSPYQDINVLVGLINEGQIHRFLPKPLRRGMVVIALKGALSSYRAARRCPALQARHAVELPRQAETDTSFTGRIISLFRNLRRT